MEENINFREVPGKIPDSPHTYTLTINRDPEYAKLADAFLKAVSESDDVEFSYVTRDGVAWVHKNGNWEKVKERKFMFETPQIK